MPFISQKDKNDLEPQYQDDYVRPSTFGEVMEAGIGQVIDEEWSISGALNREEYRNRKAYTESLIDSGELDPTPYYRKTRRGRKFDWDALSQDRDDIKSNKELEDRRNAMLAFRRQYAEDVFERGSGTARFLGSAIGYMLDPISVATMPIGYASNGAKGLAAVGRAALKAGATEMATETAIQGFVYDHKHDIDSPYDWKDALANIATASIAGGVLGGSGVGIREYIGNVRAKVKDLPSDESLEFADESLARMEETLNSNPLRKPNMTNKELVEADVKFLEGLETRKNQVFNQESPPITRSVVDGNADLHGKEKIVLDKIGQADDYAQDMIRYKEKFKPANNVEPDLKGLEIDEQVRVKETGEVVTIKSKADVMYRQAKKRRDQLMNLRRCLGA